MVLNATFNNISFISWQSVLLVEETGVHGENHQLASSFWQTLSRNVVSSTPHLSRVQTLVMIGADCMCSYKSNYHTIMTMMTPWYLFETCQLMYIRYIYISYILLSFFMCLIIKYIPILNAIYTCCGCVLMMLLYGNPSHLLDNANVYQNFIFNFSK
jgi:hypothetical protein